MIRQTDYLVNQVTRQLDGKMDEVGVEEIRTVAARMCGEAFDFLLPRVVREVEHKILAQKAPHAPSLSRNV